VRATVSGLQSALGYGVNSGYISASSLASKLSSDLGSVQNALNAGNTAVAKTALATFVNDLQTANRHSVTAAYAALLQSWAVDLSGSL